MIFSILHIILLFLIYLPPLAYALRETRETEAINASPVLFRSSMALFFACVIYDIICYASLTLGDWIMVAFICVFSLWQFYDYYWIYIRGNSNTHDNLTHSVKDDKSIG